MAAMDHRSGDSGHFSFGSGDRLNASTDSSGADDARERSSSIQASLDQFVDRRRMVPVEDISFIRELGEGSFGVVFHARYRDRDVAAKCLFNCALFEAETSTLSSLSHRNVIGYVGESHFSKDSACSLRPPTILDKAMIGNCVLLTEFAARGSLHDLIYSAETYTLRQAVKWMQDIASGLAYLHTGAPFQILHLDLKPLNVLITADGVLKIADLGTSCPGLSASGTMLFLPPRPSVQGTTRYMAPEVIRSEEYNDRADVWSFGVSCWEILVRDTPHPQLTNDFSVAYNVGTDTLHPVIPEFFPEKLSRMLHLCWQPNPSDRPSASDCRQILQDVLRNIKHDIVITPHAGTEESHTLRQPMEVGYLAQAARNLKNLPPCADCESEEEEGAGEHQHHHHQTHLAEAHHACDHSHHQHAGGHQQHEEPPPLLQASEREEHLLKWEAHLREVEGRLQAWEADLLRREHELAHHVAVITSAAAAAEAGAGVPDATDVGMLAGTMNAEAAAVMDYHVTSL